MGVVFVLVIFSAEKEISYKVKSIGGRSDAFLYMFDFIWGQYRFNFSWLYFYCCLSFYVYGIFIFSYTFMNLIYMVC